MQRESLWIAGVACLLMHSPAAAQPSGLFGNGASDEPVAEEEAGDRWMLRSPLADVKWPEIKMPEVKWKPKWGGGDGQNGENPLTRPIRRVSDATRDAVRKTKSAWSQAFDRVKLAGSPSGGGSSSEPGFFSRMFGDEEPDGAETMQDFVGAERPRLTR